MIASFKTRAVRWGVACAMLACTLSTGAIGQTVLAVYEAGGDNAMEAEFATDTGQRQGSGVQLKSGGSSLKLDAIGAFAFAPNGMLWGLIESGVGESILAPFDPLTGQRLGGSNYLQSGGTTLSFGEVGAMNFAPDGKLWGVIASGLDDAILAEFNPLTGQRLSGGGYLQSVGDIFAFTEVGAVAFASDGTMWGVIESGIGDALIAHFNPLTGQRLSGGAYLRSGGDPIAFSEIGAIGFAPGGGMWALLEAGSGAAIFDQFDLVSGERLGVGSYLKIFNSALPFSDIGAMTFRFDQTRAVPEPAIWAMMLLGFAAIGGKLRIRRTAAA